MNMPPDDLEKIFFAKGDPLKKLLGISLKLLDAQQMGILYGTNASKQKFLPAADWDRGIADRFDGVGIKGKILKYLGTRIVTMKKLSPVYFYKHGEQGLRVDNDGIISYMLRTCTDYYKKGISIMFSPDISAGIYQIDSHYAGIPFYTYNGNFLTKPDIEIKVDLKIIKHFKAKNYVSIYIPDYGILVANTAAVDLFKMTSSGFERKKEIKEKFDLLIRMVEMASLAVLGQLKGKKGARLLWRKERQLRQTSKELVENEKRYRDLYDNAPIAYFSMDEAGVISACNNKTEQLTGYLKNELIGINFKALQPRSSDEGTKGVEGLFSLINEKTDIKDKEMILRNKDGNDVWISLSLEAVRDAGDRVVDIRAMAVDISARKMLERQLLQAQKMEAIGTLAGGIAHDFNNILSPVAGYSEMLLMDDTIGEEKRREQLEIIYDCSQYAKALVNQMLTFSRQKENEYKLLQPHVFVNDALRLARSFLPSNITIKEKINEECGLLMVDPVQVHQVVMNLISNAYQAMGEKGGILTIELDQVVILPDNTLFPLVPGSYVLLKIKDTGSGIPAKVMDRMFEPFFTTQREGKGTGIGLSVVHGIIKSHDGYINVKSSPGEGSCFEVYLPVHSRDVQPERNPEPEHPLKKGDEHILLVDDDKRVAFMEQHMLEKLGYRVSCFLESTEALAAFEKTPDVFDLVITDLTMPDINGFELSGRMCGIRPDIPVILCTGFGEHIDKKKFHHQGIKGFLNKPVAVKDVAALIRKILDKKDG